MFVKNNNNINLQKEPRRLKCPLIKREILHKHEGSFTVTMG